MEYLVAGGKESLAEKLQVLTDAAKYDVACTSSGVERKGNGKSIGNCVAAGICHSFSGDGRCISLLKILLTNECIFDCKYCRNRRSNDIPRATFTPEEICTLTMEFYRRNYIEGLFLSSGIIRDPTFTMELLCRTLALLRNKYRFNGYVHVKAIPGADPEVIERTGYLADRMSVNLELPTAEGLRTLAPNKHRRSILTPMRQIQNGIQANRNDLALYRHAPRFVAGGQSTQVIVGATPESDYQIINVAGECGGGTVSEIWIKEGILFRFCECHRGQESSGPARGPASSAGTQAVPGGLAAALLRVPGGGASG